MLLSLIALIVGLITLTFSSDKFISHSALIAQKLNINPFIIGFTLIALGTSAPEMVVSAIAAIEQSPEIAIGNAFGSNIANIGLVFGITLILKPILIQRSLLSKEVPILIGVTFLSGFLIVDEKLTPLDGILLILAFLIALYVLLNSNTMNEEGIEKSSKKISTTKSSSIALLSLSLLIGSSKLLVWAATGIATSLGVSELLIGLTIVAIGTSLPELAASVTSVLKGHQEIAIGNILGSNLFNLTTVLPFPALIAPSILDENIFQRDYFWVLGTTMSLVIFMIYFQNTKTKCIPRWCGYLLVSFYTIYLTCLYFNANS